VIRATMIFAYTNDAGRTGSWSESWYLNTSLSDPVMRNKFAALMADRALMLPVPGKINGQRFTQVNDAAFSSGAAQKSLAYNTVVPGVYDNRGAGPQQDIPQLALQCRVQGTGVNNVKNYDIHGIPDGLVRGGVFIPDPQFNQGFSNWLQQLRNDSWGFRAIDLSQPKIGIASIGADGTYVTTANQDYAKGQYLQLLRVKDVNGKSVKGVFQIASVTNATTGVLLGWKGQVVGQNGNLRRRNWIYPACAPGTNEMVTVTTRKIGRPSKPYLGRSTARR